MLPEQLKIGLVNVLKIKILREAKPDHKLSKYLGESAPEKEVSIEEVDGFHWCLHGPRFQCVERVGKIV